MSENHLEKISNSHRLCMVSYTFGGNGPWNYMFERPPEGVKLVHQVGLYLGQTEKHYQIASDWITMEDGGVQPVRKQNYTVESCRVDFL